MGTAFKVNRGGGGCKVVAFIIASYPVGSVCTCSDGNKTLKLKDTSGYGVFYVPYIGTWTVTATDGTETVSVPVAIIGEGQSESVELSYDPNFYIVKNGVINPDVGFNTNLRSDSNASLTVTQQDGYLRLYANHQHNGRVTDAKVDVSKYSAIVLDCNPVAVGNWVAVALANAIGHTGGTAAMNSLSAKTQTTAKGRRTISCNIASVNGEFYPCVACNGASSDQEIHVYNLYLVP